MKENMFPRYLRDDVGLESSSVQDFTRDLFSQTVFRKHSSFLNLLSVCISVVLKVLHHFKQRFSF